MKLKINKIWMLSILATAISACNNGTPSPSNSAQVATTPQPMPNSAWVNTNLSTYLSANGLTSRNSYYAATTNGLYLSTKKTSDSTEHVIFYSAANQNWSDVTGNLGITLAAAGNELQILTNGNGLLYVVSSDLYTSTVNGIWSKLTLPESYTTRVYMTEAQTRKLAIVGLKSTPSTNTKFFQLENDNSITALGDAESYPIGAISYSPSISPNGAQRSTRYNFTAGYYKISINRNLYPESIPNVSYATSAITNKGYVYFYPTSNPANNKIIYECANGNCKIIHSTDSILNVTESTSIVSFSASSELAGTFFMNLQTRPESTIITNTSYICNATTCTPQGNQQTISKSSATLAASSYTTYINNSYSTTPSSSTFGYVSGFYWLSNGTWISLAPSLNDGQESTTATYDQVVQVCSYTPSTSLIRYLSNDGISEILYTNSANNTWQNISQTPTASGTVMSYANLTTATNPSNGATTFGGIINLEKTSSGYLANISIYPQNIVCPATY